MWFRVRYRCWNLCMLNRRYLLIRLCLIGQMLRGYSFNFVRRMRLLHILCHMYLCWVRWIRICVGVMESFSILRLCRRSLIMLRKGCSCLMMGFRCIFLLGDIVILSYWRKFLENLSFLKMIYWLNRHWINKIVFRLSKYVL